MDGVYDLSYREYFVDRKPDNCIDELTGVLNRRGISEYVSWLIEKGRPFSLFLIDIDNFKNVNDTYGHIVGDTVIAQTARTFVSACAKEGVVGRYGGDEFVIIFEDVTDYQEVWSRGSKMTHLRMGGVEEYGIPNLTVTVTVGISRFPLDAQTVEGLITVADKALYRGKSKGRHCFIIYLPEKHANISLRGDRDKKQNLMQLSLGIFNNLTACGEDIATAVSTVFKSFVSYYMFDHICLETHVNMNHSVFFTLSEQKQFKHLPYGAIDEIVNSAGYASISDVTQLHKDLYADIISGCKKQGIKSLLFCRISAYGKDYGFIRVDTANTARLWQNGEMSMVIVAAKAIALLLHYQGKTLEDLPLIAPVEAGGSD